LLIDRDSLVRGSTRACEELRLVKVCGGLWNVF
jgi:hypothetical protein